MERRPSDDLEVERMYAEVRGRLFRRSPEPIRLGRYEVLDKIGAGGMGMVYAGRDPQLGRAVALKLIRAGRLAAGGDLEQAQRRLLREARAMARVSSPFVVTVYEAGTHGQQVFVAMELVDGQTLTRWLSTTRSWTEVVGIFIQAGRGLAAVHEAGLVHRDFKPDNVLIGADGRARVADFGLAAIDGDLPGRPAAYAGGSGLTLTRTGAVVGSLAYMSPEQHRRQTVDARSDQFAFCVALFEGLVGHRPFGGETAEGLRRDVLEGAVDWREASKLPDRVLRLLRRGLALSPADRWEDMTQIVEELDRALYPKRRWIYLGAAASLVVGSGIATASLVAEGQPLCDRAAAEAERAWGAARRETVLSALRATGRDFSERTAQQVEERLDEHAQAWSLAHAQVCDDAERRDDRDAVVLQVVCLDRTALETEALTRALVEQPDQFVEHATLAVYKLRDPSSCLESSQVWLPPDAQLDTSPMPILAALARAEARLSAADDAGIEDAEAALTLARSMGERTYEAEALLLRGMFSTRAKRWPAAERDLLAANDVAEQYGVWEVAVRARTELLFVVGYRQQRFGEARVWSVLAQSALTRAGAGGLVEVRLLNAQGLVFAEQDRSASARASLEDALTLARASLGADHPGLAATLENLGRLELQEGRAGEARARVSEAYRIRASTLGPSHPDTVRTEELLAQVQP